jgi:hypothetical protein
MRKPRAPAKQLAPFLPNDTAGGDALYWLRIMKYCLVFLLVAIAVPGLYAAEKPYQTGKIVNIQQKTMTRILYYQVDTPITKNEPYYEVSVLVKDTIYVGDYTPSHSTDTLPEEWNVPQAEVRLRLEKHYMFLTRPAGTELQFVITKRIAVATAQKTSEPPSPKK